MKPIRRVHSLVQGVLWCIRPGGLRAEVNRLNAPDRSAPPAMEPAHRFAQSAWADAGDLRAYEKRVHSQNGEDGIIEEILRRIGAGSDYFVEFGVESGTECNCARLALEHNWSGLFLEPEPAMFSALAERYSDKPKVKCVQTRVHSGNIEDILAEQRVPEELGLLSIDIDGNDYWVWAAIKRWRPRIVVIEYNASFPPPKKWVMKEDLNYRWNGTNYHGASLASLVGLGRKKGYTLVGTNSTGVNAFFVRDDLVTEDRFLDPALHYHYSAPHYGPYLGGHPRGSGPYLEI